MGDAHGHHHGHGHDHDHHHGLGHHHHGGSRNALLVSLILNGLFLFVEAGAGWYYDSLALLSDAAHMLSDVAALALALIAAQLALRPRSPGRTFGLVRAEVLGAFVNAVLLLVAVIFIFKEAIERLITGPPEVVAGPVLLVAVMGLAINLGSAFFLWRSASDNLNVRGALAHMLADALGSVGAIVSAVCMLAFGWYAADPWVSMFIGVLILVGTWTILRDSTAVLMGFAPRNLDESEVHAAFMAIEGVTEVHELHMWTVGSEKVTLTAHLVADAQVGQAQVLCAAEEVIRGRFGVTHSTLQVELDDVDCDQRDCPVIATNEDAHVH